MELPAEEDVLGDEAPVDGPYVEERPREVECGGEVGVRREEGRWGGEVGVGEEKLRR